MGYAGPAFERCPQCRKCTEDKDYSGDRARWIDLPTCPKCFKCEDCGFKNAEKWQLQDDPRIVMVVDRCSCGYITTLRKY